MTLWEYSDETFKFFKGIIFKVSIITYNHNFKFQIIPMKDKDGKLLHY